jgi:hypothetical protein
MRELSFRVAVTARPSPAPDDYMRQSLVVNELEREALRAHFYGESFESIQARLGIPFDESIHARLFAEMNELLGYGPGGPKRRPRRLFEPVPPVADPPDQFTTRDELVVALERVPATEAVSTWESLLEQAPGTGLWPVLLSETHPGRVRDLLIEPATEDGPSADSLVAEGLRADARRLLDQWWSSWNIDSEEDSPGAQGLDRSRQLPPCKPQLIPESGLAVIGLFPCRDSYEVPALLNYGGWNGSPTADEHVTVLKYWQETCSARLQSLAEDTVELAVAQPPKSPAEALALAQDHFSYAPELSSNTIYGGIHDLASALPASRCWHFWWD